MSIISSLFFPHDLFIFTFLKIYLFILFYFWLRWVLVVACGIFVEARGIFCCSAWASLQFWRVGFLFSSCGVKAPEHVGSVVCGTPSLQLRFMSSVVVAACGLSCPAACGSQFPDQGLNLRPLHCKADSLPLDHQRSPDLFIL